MSPFFEQPLKKNCVKPHHLHLLDLSVKRLTASLVGIKVKSAICFNSSQIASLGVSVSTLSHNLIYPLTSKKITQAPFFSSKISEKWFLISYGFGALYLPKPQMCYLPRLETKHMPRLSHDVREYCWVFHFESTAGWFPQICRNPRFTQ